VGLTPIKPKPKKVAKKKPMYKGKREVGKSQELIRGPNRSRRTTEGGKEKGGVGRNLWKKDTGRGLSERCFLCNTMLDGGFVVDHCSFLPKKSKRRGNSLGHGIAPKRKREGKRLRPGKNEER